MNCAELRASIARKSMTLRSLSDELNISEQTMQNKLSGTTEFKNSEIVKLAGLLSLSLEDVNQIFFDSNVN